MGPLCLLLRRFQIIQMHVVYRYVAVSAECNFLNINNLNIDSYICFLYCSCDKDSYLQMQIHLISAHRYSNCPTEISERALAFVGGEGQFFLLIG